MSAQSKDCAVEVPADEVGEWVNLQGNEPSNLTLDQVAEQVHAAYSRGFLAGRVQGKREGYKIGWDVGRRRRMSGEPRKDRLAKLRAGILAGVKNGSTDAEIATVYRLSVRTVKRHKAILREQGRLY